MKTTLKVTLLCGLVAVVAAQLDPWYDDLDADLFVRRPRPPYAAAAQVPHQQQVAPRPPSPPPPPKGPSTQALLEDRAVEQQNRLLQRLFARSFPATTAEEFHEVIVQLYVHGQRELDLCGEFLWDTHLLTGYRRCASIAQRTIRQQVQWLVADIRAVTLAEYAYYADY